jgi:hypothetical protein
MLESENGGWMLKYRLLETLKGIGTVTASSGEQLTMPGLKEFRGSIQPVCFFKQNG